MADNKNNKSSDDFINSILGDLNAAEPSEKPSNESFLPEASNEADKPAPQFPIDHSNQATTIQEQPNALPSVVESSAETVNYQMPKNNVSGDVEKTVVYGGRQQQNDQGAAEKVSYGVARPGTRSPGSANASAADMQLGQAENFRIAQARLNELEVELEKLRGENELLHSANQITQAKSEELVLKLDELEKSRNGQISQYQSEMEIYRDSLSGKDSEIIKLRQKVSDLESRLKQDLKKIRVRERELENRLELSKMEKDSLLRTKDETILDLKRKTDQLNMEMDNYRHRISDLNTKIENNHEQLSRTVKALRLALTNLEVNDHVELVTSAPPVRKAE